MSGTALLEPAAAHAALLGELRRLADRLPVPDGSWHPHAAAIGACRADFEAAIDAAEARPETLDLLAALTDGAAAPADRHAAARWLAAWDRLGALPRPEGRHPYLDEIVPALDAFRLLLVALGAGPG